MEKQDDQISLSDYLLNVKCQFDNLTNALIDIVKKQQEIIQELKEKNEKA